MIVFIVYFLLLKGLTFRSAARSFARRRAQDLQKALAMFWNLAKELIGFTVVAIFGLMAAAFAFGFLSGFFG